MSKVYIYKTTVSIGDTNIFQNMYFSNFFRVTGKVRELWVKDCVKNFDQSLRGNLLLGTRRASCEFFHDFFLFDEITVKMQFTWIKKVSTEILFQFYKNQIQEIQAEARQTIIFLDRSHHFIPIPENFKQAILEYSVDK